MFALVFLNVHGQGPKAKSFKDVHIMTQARKAKSRGRPQPQLKARSVGLTLLLLTIHSDAVSLTPRPPCSSPPSISALRGSGHVLVLCPDLSAHVLLTVVR